VIAVLTAHVNQVFMEVDVYNDALLVALAITVRVLGVMEDVIMDAI